MKSANYPIDVFLGISPESPVYPFVTEATEWYESSVKAQFIENNIVWKLSIFSKTFSCNCGSHG